MNRFYLIRALLVSFVVLLTAYQNGKPGSYSGWVAMVDMKTGAVYGPILDRVTILPLGIT